MSVRTWAYAFINFFAALKEFIISACSFFSKQTPLPATSYLTSFGLRLKKVTRAGTDTDFLFMPDGHIQCSSTWLYINVAGLMLNCAVIK
jgi:hypothetical protein